MIKHAHFPSVLCVCVCVGGDPPLKLFAGSPHIRIFFLLTRAHPQMLTVEPFPSNSFDDAPGKLVLLFWIIFTMLGNFYPFMLLHPITAESGWSWKLDGWPERWANKFQNKCEGNGNCVFMCGKRKAFQIDTGMVWYRVVTLFFVSVILTSLFFSFPSRGRGRPTGAAGWTHLQCISICGT